MQDSVSTEKIWLNPYIIAILGIIILYSTNFAPIAFILTGFIYGFLSKKVINIKNLAKYTIVFSVLQLIINFIITMCLEKSYFFFAPEIYLKQYLCHFALSLILGSLIFVITNLIVYGIFKIIEKIKNKKLNSYKEE
ncbi:hypothetical protein IJ182_03270 [bacterium]|nr:hypothetical protein [bacterium]